MKTRKLKLHIIIYIVAFTIIPFVSLGYSALSTTLNIRGDFLVLPPQDPIIGNYDKSIRNTYQNTLYRLMKLSRETPNAEINISITNEMPTYLNFIKFSNYF